MPLHIYPSCFRLQFMLFPLIALCFCNDYCGLTLVPIVCSTFSYGISHGNGNRDDDRADTCSCCSAFSLSSRFPPNNSIIAPTSSHRVWNWENRIIHVPASLARTAYGHWKCVMHSSTKVCNAFDFDHFHIIIQR